MDETRPAPTTEAPPAIAESVQEMAAAASGLTAEKSAMMAQWIREDLAKSKLTPEQAAKAFDELGAPVEQRGPDTRSPDVQLLDQHFPEAKPEEYVIHYGQDMTPELKAFDTSARTWLSGAGFPRNLGTSLVNTIDEVTRQTQRMTEDQLAEYGQREYQKLVHLYGDGLTEKLQAAGRMVNDLEQKTPGLKNLLRSRGIGDSARTVVLLIDQSTRYWARRRA